MTAHTITIEANYTQYRTQWIISMPGWIGAEKKKHEPFTGIVRTFATALRYANSGIKLALLSRPGIVFRIVLIEGGERGDADEKEHVELTDDVLPFYILKYTNQ